MATCDVEDLMTDAGCLLCFSSKQISVITASLLCKLLQQLDPMATCNPATLLSEASSLLYLTDKELGGIQISLLCKIYDAAVTGALSGVHIDIVDPVLDPGVDSQIWVNRTTGGVWYWNDGTGHWIELIV